MKKNKYFSDPQAFLRLQFRAYEKPLLWMILFFEIACPLLLSMKGDSFDSFSLICAAALPAATVLIMNLLSRRFHIDKCLFLCAAFLCSLGLITLRSVKPGNAPNHAIYLLVGAVAMIIGVLLTRALDGSEKIYRLGAIAVIGVLLLPFAFHVGGDAHSWVKVGSHQFQPSELMKPALIFILASGFTRGSREKYWWQYALFSVICFGIIALQGDLGSAALYFMLIVALFAAGTGRVDWTVSGLVIAFIAAYFLIKYRDSIPKLSTLSNRIAIWQEPFAYLPPNATRSRDSSQIVSGLISVASGGLTGAGLGLSYAGNVYVVASDYIFAAIAEEYGMIFAISVIGIYLIILLRGVSVAMNARTRFHSLIAFGCTFIITVQMLTIVAGNLLVIPLTGVTLPFVSDGGSSLVSCLMMMGMLLGVSGMNAEDEGDDYKKLKGRQLL